MDALALVVLLVVVAAGLFYGACVVVGIFGAVNAWWRG